MSESFKQHEGKKISKVAQKLKYARKFATGELPPDVFPPDTGGNQRGMRTPSALHACGVHMSLAAPGVSL
jgi:hypothetical protein